VSQKHTSHKKGFQTTKPGTKPAQGNSGGLNANAIILGLLAVGVVALIGYLIWGGGSGGSSGGTGNYLKTATGLEYEDIVVGTGASPTTGKNVKVHYTGTLTNGTKFDSSVDRGQPYEFPIGVGQVIKGWDEGLMTMKVGGKRKLRIPPKLGYGANPNGKIPANATLLFDVELVDAK
jgi:FKBP-type peptidyl-prolyl cis-trans isomerase